MNLKSVPVRTLIVLPGSNVVSHLDPIRVRRAVKLRQRTLVKWIGDVAVERIQAVKHVPVDLKLIAVMGWNVRGVQSLIIHTFVAEILSRYH